MHSSGSVLLELHFGGLDLSVGATVIWMLAATAVLLIALFLASRGRFEAVPKNPFQNILEYVVEFIRKQIVETAGLGAVWTPFFLSLFLFILFGNLSGVIPGAQPSTGNINVTGSLAAMVFITGYVLRFRRNGFAGFFKSLIPEGVKGPIIIMMYPIELVSQLAKPFSLAIRLFANLTGGHLMLVTIIGFSVLFRSAVVGVLSVAGTAVISLFELFVALIQAYVFSFLSAIFFAECLEGHGSGHREKEEIAADVQIISEE